jgi:hypothetical protein
MAANISQNRPDKIKVISHYNYIRLVEAEVLVVYVCSFNADFVLPLLNLV